MTFGDQFIAVVVIELLGYFAATFRGRRFHRLTRQGEEALKRNEYAEADSLRAQASCLRQTMVEDAEADPESTPAGS